MKVARGKPPSVSARRSDFVSQAAAAFAVFLWCGCRVFRSSEQYAHKVRAPKFSNDLQCFMVTSQHSDPPVLPGSDWSGPRWYQASCRQELFFGLRPPQSTGCRLSQPVEFGCKISGGQTGIWFVLCQLSADKIVPDFEPTPKAGILLYNGNLHWLTVVKHPETMDFSFSRHGWWWNGLEESQVLKTVLSNWTFGSCLKDPQLLIRWEPHTHTISSIAHPWQEVIFQTLFQVFLVLLGTCAVRCEVVPRHPTYPFFSHTLRTETWMKGKTLNGISHRWMTHLETDIFWSFVLQTVEMLWVALMVLALANDL